MSKNIVLIDDNPTDTKIASLIIEKEGMIVTCFQNAFDAIDWLSQNTPDLFLIDINMPSMNGFDFLTRVKRMSQVAKTPILMMSGRNQIRDVHKALQLGANDYIIKPIDVEIFQNKLQSLTRNSDIKWQEYEVTDEIQKEGFIWSMIQVKSISEVGITLVSPFVSKVGDLIKIQSELLKSLGKQDILLRCLSSTKFESGYLNKYSYIGFSEADRKKIRLICRDIWTTEKSKDL